ncbi:hypothetical protein MK852_23790 [Shewanella benthica]|uniref:primase-helicase family protein n=1 Tax=Shewanella benthica TaxID=43661 RepID=UPI00187987DB|nr:primase-helicase family protein [Shewanella benthica]MBE7216381.1 hypothetical protein [Shewanella benthica]MCL1065117.1 hypothetical protein [Shewanella benthica]
MTEQPNNLANVIQALVQNGLSLEDATTQVISIINTEPTKPSGYEIRTSLDLLDYYIDQHSIQCHVGYFIKNGKIISYPELETDLLLWCQANDIQKRFTESRFIRAAFDSKDSKTLVQRRNEIHKNIVHSDLPTLKSVDGDFMDEFDEFEFKSGLHFLDVYLIKSWMWNVKRILAGDNPEQIPMPVFYSTVGGTGKSYFVSELLKPLQELAQNKKVSDVSDKHSSHQWGKLSVADFDEMAGLEKTDMNTLKTWCTQSSINARKMHSENFHYIQKITQGIGSSNHSIDSIVWDTTGTRRFYQVEIPTDGRWLKMINDIDFIQLWRCVDEYSSDPLNGYQDVIFKKQQDEQRKKHAVEMWWDDNGDKWESGDRIKSCDLYEDFDIWRIKNNHNVINSNVWGRSLRSYLSDVLVKPSKTNAIYVKR